MASTWVESGTITFRGLPEQTPLWTASKKESKLSNIARAITAQHLKDREWPYLDDPALRLAREEAWQNIALLNPNQRANIITLMRGLELAKNGEDQISKAGGIDPLAAGYFVEMTNPNSQAILIDMLRGLVHHNRYETAYDDELFQYEQLGKALYGDKFKMNELPESARAPFNRARFPRLRTISPEMIMELALGNKIDVPRNFTYAQT